MADEYKKIGETLGRKRVELQKEFEEISEIIKVSPEYLKAIESGDVKALPSIIYYKLFVRAYAQELGLDGNKLLEEYEIEDKSVERNGETDEVKNEDVKNRRRPESETPLLKIGIILAAIVIVVFALIIILVPSDDNNGEPDDMERTEEVTEPVQDTQAVITDKKAVVEESIPVENLPMRLGLLVTKDSCWIAVAADGDTVLENVLHRGARRNYTADYRFQVSMGNPYNVELRINDTLLKDISNKSGVIKGFEINRLNKSDLFYIPEDSLAQ